jgi:hypothetical protein
LIGIIASMRHKREDKKTREKGSEYKTEQEKEENETNPTENIKY